MAAMLFALPSPAGWRVPAYLALGAACYAALLWLLGFFGDEEKMHLRRLLGREA
jgi:hypothetical protein